METVYLSYCMLMTHKKSSTMISHTDVAPKNSIAQEKLIHAIVDVLDDAQVASLCFEHPILIKEKKGQSTLYLGYAVNTNKFKTLCFFESAMHEENAHVIRKFTTNKQNVVATIEHIKSSFGITSAEELFDLVNHALWMHKIQDTQQKIHDELFQWLSAS